MTMALGPALGSGQNVPKLHIISKRRLREFWEKHPDAKMPLEKWFKTARSSNWLDFSDVKRTFGNASAVPLECGITATVFNIGGNKYRLITRTEYQYRRVYVKVILTHAEYDKGKWKDDLCLE
jgi:mRNA interferase HigB